MFKFLLNLPCAKWKKPLKNLLWLHPRQACNKLPEGKNCVGLRIGCCVVVNQIKDEIKELVREVETDDVERILDGLEHCFFHLTTCGVFLASFLRQVLVQRKYPSEE